MASTAQRMREMRSRRRVAGLREVRFVVPDARDAEVRRRVAEAVARLDPADEEAAMRWIEAATSGDDWAGGDAYETG